MYNWLSTRIHRAKKCDHREADDNNSNIFCKKRTGFSYFFHHIFHMLYLVAKVVDQSGFSDVNCHSDQNIFFYDFYRLHIQCIYHRYIINLCQRFSFDNLGASLLILLQLCFPCRSYSDRLLQLLKDKVRLFFLLHLNMYF